MAGVGTRTLFRWLEAPEFREAYLLARRQAFGQASARLQQATGAAVSVLLTLMLDSNAPAASRVRAAQGVLDLAAKALELDDIEVRLPTSSERTDADLAKAALNALEWEAAIPADKLDVTVSKGWVTLKGEVEYGFQKRLAERVVERLSGVKGVTNLITVKPRLSPEDLKQNIEKALVRNAETDAQRITVEVEGSKVILRGTVRSYAEKKAAEDAAWAAPGVSEVENRIVISLP